MIGNKNNLSKEDLLILARALLIEPPSNEYGNPWKIFIKKHKDNPHLAEVLGDDRVIKNRTADLSLYNWVLIFKNSDKNTENNTYIADNIDSILRIDRFVNYSDVEFILLHVKPEDCKRVLAKSSFPKPHPFNDIKDPQKQIEIINYYLAKEERLGPDINKIDLHISLFPKIVNVHFNENAIDEKKFREYADKISFSPTVMEPWYDLIDAHCKDYDKDNERQKDFALEFLKEKIGSLDTKKAKNLNFVTYFIGHAIEKGDKKSFDNIRNTIEEVVGKDVVNNASSNLLHIYAMEPNAAKCKSLIEKGGIAPDKKFFQLANISGDEGLQALAKEHNTNYNGAVDRLERCFKAKGSTIAKKTAIALGTTALVGAAAAGIIAAFVASPLIAAAVVISTTLMVALGVIAVTGIDGKGGIKLDFLH